MRPLNSKRLSKFCGSYHVHYSHGGKSCHATKTHAVETWRLNGCDGRVIRVADGADVTPTA